MRPLLLCLCCILLFASCQQYDNTIVARGLAIGSFRPVDELTADSADAGLVYIDTMHAGNPLISDSTWSFAPTWKQSWTWDGQRHNRAAVILGVVALTVSLLIFIVLNNKGIVQAGIVIPMMISIVVCGCVIGGALEWERSGMGLTITKAQAQNLLKDPGNLGPAWDQIDLQ